MDDYRESRAGAAGAAASSATQPARGTVLLARPHQFIVGIMSEALLRCGYTPLPRGEDRGYPLLNSPTLRGAIISTAIRSSVPEDHLTVYSQLRTMRPDLALMFATLVPTRDYARTLQSVLGRRVGEATVLTLDAVADPRWPGRRRGDVLLVAKGDIEDTRPALERALRAWFG